MIRVLVLAVFLLSATTGFLLAQQAVPPQAPRIVWLPSQGPGATEAVVATRILPPTALICAELAPGYTPCRSVAEFREWIRRGK